MFHSCVPFGMTLSEIRVLGHAGSLGQGDGRLTGGSSLRVPLTPTGRSASIPLAVRCPHC